MTSRLFIDEQARAYLLQDAARMAVVEAARQAVPLMSVLRLYARRVVDLYMLGLFA